MKVLKSMKLLTAIIIVIFAQSYLLAQEKEFNINDYEWLVGHWVGDGFGGVSEEVWAPAADGVMMGMYRNVQGGKVSFYEFIHLSKDGMKLKHFKPDLIGWEDKEDMVHFKFIDFDANTLIFDALKIYKIDDNNIKMELKLENKGVVSVEAFNFSKKG